MSCPVVAILGPTASGKSDLAQHVALRIDGEVVSADSMQVYRGMDIGTAKIPQTNMLVPHHLIDILDPGEAFSAQLFQSLSRSCFSDIQNRGRVPILCGGTGLYVQSALEDMHFPKGDQQHNPVRTKYEMIAAEHGNQAVWDRLNEVDPSSAALLHPNNVRRVIRALEMYEQGVSYATQVQGMKELSEVVPSIRFALKRDPAYLADRINKRVENMFEMGLVKEVQLLLDDGWRAALTAPQAIGYKEVVSALDGNISMNEAMELIKTATRRYAKRQRTWLRRDSRLIWLDADSLSFSRMVDCVVETYLQRTGSKINANAYELFI